MPDRMRVMTMVLGMFIALALGAMAGSGGYVHPVSGMGPQLEVVWDDALTVTTGSWCQSACIYFNDSTVSLHQHFWGCDPVSSGWAWQVNGVNGGVLLGGCLWDVGGGMVSGYGTWTGDPNYCWCNPNTTALVQGHL